mmetsp:Transcript_33231/g.73488  ORF Transcript_33231/g.73488 Transcript_33231/m.73488 type:complete len:319 (+) Transcript_33231:1389-2345(+)
MWQAPEPTAVYLLLYLMRLLSYGLGVGVLRPAPAAHLTEFTTWLPLLTAQPASKLACLPSTPHHPPPLSLSTLPHIVWPGLPANSEQQLVLCALACCPARHVTEADIALWGRFLELPLDPLHGVELIRGNHLLDVCHVGLEVAVQLPGGPRRTAQHSRLLGHQVARHLHGHPEAEAQVLDLCDGRVGRDGGQCGVLEHQLHSNLQRHVKQRGNGLQPGLDGVWRHLQQGRLVADQAADHLGAQAQAQRPLVNHGTQVPKHDKGTWVLHQQVEALRGLLAQLGAERSQSLTNGAGGNDQQGGLAGRQGAQLLHRHPERH